MIPTAEEMIEAHRIYMVASGLSANTVTEALWLLHKTHTDLPAGLIEAFPDELTTWLANPTWSAQTRSTYRQHLRRFYMWATREEDPWMTYDPSTGLRRPTIPRRLPRPASDDQVATAIHRADMPYRLHCRLAAYQGLRCIEIARLGRDDVSEQTTYIHGKGDTHRLLPTHPLVWELIHDLPPGPVTRKVCGRPADAHWVSNATRQHLHRLGARISMHRLRHWYGTTVQRLYRDARVTQELLRHASPSSTAGYTLVAEASMREAMACLPDLTGLPDPAGSGATGHGGAPAEG